jgi:hypothetical protein
LTELDFSFRQFAQVDHIRTVPVRSVQARNKENLIISVARQVKTSVISRRPAAQMCTFSKCFTSHKACLTEKFSENDVKR